MKWTARAPVDWPSDAAWAELARQLREHIDATDATAALDLGHGDRWEVVRGELAQPGSYYRFQSPRLTRGRVAGRIDDDGELHFELAGMPTKEGPVTGTLVADGMSRFSSLASDGQIGPLRWEAAGSIANRSFVAEVALPWLRFSVRFRERHGELLGEIETRIRSIAGPLVNKLIKEFGGEDLGSDLQSFTTAVAESLSEAARGEFNWEDAGAATAKPEVPAVDPRVVELDRYSEQLVRGVRNLHSQLDHSGWWSRRGKAWAKRAEHDLPRPVGIGEGQALAWELRSSVITRLREVPHRRRLQLLDDVVAVRHERIRVQDEFQRALEQGFEHEVAPTNYDEMLDLDWLRSVPSVLGHTVRSVRLTSAKPPADQLDGYQA